LQLFCKLVNPEHLKIIPTKEGIRQALYAHRCSDKSIGLVPTMGALHNGHLSLIRKSKLNSDVTVVSIFVNPSQFNNISDLENYPRTLEKDLQLLEEAGVDYVFVPDEKEMYPENVSLKFDFSELETSLEGAFRPGHFNGVGIIVCKLFHIVHPSHVFFGQKDLQQVAVIKRLIRDLSFDVKIYVVPTLRESDGLAMSSRNALLSEEERKAAVLLYETLSLAKDELLGGVNWFDVKEKITQRFRAQPLAKLEYFELVKSDTMEAISDLSKEDSCSVCTAAYIGKIRLIDNMTVIQ
jgi:pantoate--beta-alanine ligase